MCVAGTTGVRDGAVVSGGAGPQARAAFEIALGALARAGASVEDVIRTRMYVVHATDCDVVGLVHHEIFGEVRPAATMVLVAGLIDPELLVEVEIDAAVIAMVDAMVDVPVDVPVDATLDATIDGGAESS